MLKKDKASPWRRLILWKACAAGVLSQVWAATAWALPVMIAWQVPLAKDETYRLEVSTEAGFGVIVHDGEIKGGVNANYPWEAPAEGVYHWRLARPHQQGDGQEVMTFVSGSFAAIDPGAPRERPARLTWQPEEGADRYKLYVVDADGSARTMISTSPAFTVPATDKALMIEVVPYSGTERLFRHYHFNPTLTLDAGTPPPPATVLAAPAPPAPEAEPAATEPVAVAPVEPAPVVEAPTLSRPRVHMVQLFGLAGQESLHLQKLEVDLLDAGTVQGAGAGFWTNPLAGLVVSGQGTYHEHQADLTQPEILPDQTVPLFAARYSIDLGIGWDVLSAFESRWHRLVFSFATAGTQLPFLPLAYSSSLGDAPVLEQKELTFLGGSAAYGYFGEHVAAIVEGGVLQNNPDDAAMEFQRLLIEVYVGERVALQLGGVNRLTTSARCHSDKETCLAEGKTRVTALERVAYLGIAQVFK